MVDYLLPIATFFILLVTISKRTISTRFFFAFYGLFLSLSIIFQGAGLAGLLLLFNLSILSTTLLAIYENADNQQEAVPTLSRKAGIGITLLFLLGLLTSHFLFQKFFYPFNLLLGIYSLLQSGFIKRFTAVKIIESTIYGALLLLDIIGFYIIILINLWMAISSIALLGAAMSRRVK